MSKKERIRIIEENLKFTRERYRKGEIRRDVWERIQADGRRRIKQLRKSKGIDLRRNTN